jgi:hypothetical protein
MYVRTYVIICLHTYIHTYIHTIIGWALQSGTSHFLGQNFAKAFDVYFSNEKTGREVIFLSSFIPQSIAYAQYIHTYLYNTHILASSTTNPVQVYCLQHEILDNITHSNIYIILHTFNVYFIAGVGDLLGCIDSLDRGHDNDSF